MAAASNSFINGAFSRDWFKEGSSQEHLTLLLILTTFAGVLCTIWLLNKILFTRLDKLRNFVVQLGTAPYTPVRLRLPGPDDELQSAASGLNRLLDRLNNDYERQRAQSDVLRLVAENGSFKDAFGIIRTVLDRRYPGAKAELLPIYPTYLSTPTVPNLWAVSIRGRAGERYGQLQLTFPGVLPDDITQEAAWMADLLGVAAEQERLREELSYQAYSDELTGLLNRAGLLRALTGQLVQLTQQAPHAAPNETEAQEDPDPLLAVLHLNLDRFKRVNDLLGHASGDELLRQIARRLEDFQQERLLDIRVARLGSDEFVLSTTHLSTEAEVYAYATRLSAALSEPVAIQGQPYQPSVSLGYALSSSEPASAPASHQASYHQGSGEGHHPETLLRRAALATEHLKRNGAGRVAGFTAGLQDALQDRLNLEADLRAALRDSQFELAYQPQLSLTGGQLIGTEALLRWNHPTRGMIPPTLFVRMAEEAGLSTELGQWVLARAIWQAAQWHASGLDVPVSVNLSASQLLHPQISGQIQALLQEHRLPANRLILEVTENLLRHATPDSELHRTLSELHALGISLTLDDFGTGYSSLTDLHHLPIHTVKVHRALIRELPSDPDATRIVETLTRLGQQLHLKVLAEGVERPEQAALLSSLGCAGAQGHLYAYPMPAQQIPRFLQGHPALLSVAKSN